MAFATTRTIALEGLSGHLIDVQVDVSPGMVTTTMVGRADAALSEARDRVRMAVANSAGPWPTTRRVTILLSPADLPKRGTHFDLAIAVGVKAAEGLVPAESLADTVFIGELTLSGGLRPVSGVLPMAMSAARHGIRCVYVPEPQVAEASLVPGLTVVGLRSLGQVVAQLRTEEVPDAPPVVTTSGTRLLRWRGEDQRDDLDMADIRGLAETRFALEVAAAGGHHVMLSGPKGSGKTSLAERLPGILPDLDRDAALELTALHSLTGSLDGPRLLSRPPWSAPHHDASKTSILGGGSGRVRPGEISRAHHGVLFLDEFPLFRADVIDALRQPLESGEVTVARGEESATFPARALVVLAANPCACGDYHPDVGLDRCRCREQERRHYRRKLEGPMADRIDIWREVQPASPTDMADPLARSEDSATVRARVSEARRVQARRHAGRAWRLNGAIPSAALLEEWPLPSPSRDLVDAAVRSGRLSRRGAVRVHRLAWTVADLAGRPRPGIGDTQVALALRLGEALPLAALECAG